MSHLELTNHVHARRECLGWSQAELARRAGVSRAAISAIEIGRIVPSVAVALALARTLGCRVDEVFAAPGFESPAAEWAWPPRTPDDCYWEAEVGGRRLRYPLEATAAGLLRHDGRGTSDSRSPARESPPPTLVMATCDPAASLLAEQYHQQTPFRLLILMRSSGDALQLLANNLVHVAGMHLSSPGQKQGGAAIASQRLGRGFSILHLAHWQEGVAISPGLGTRSLSQAVKPRIRWVGRDEGSGARLLQDKLLKGRKAPAQEARDHRGVAEAIRQGFADAGVCHELTSAQAGLDFLKLDREDYDLCFRTAIEADPRTTALLAILRSKEFRQKLAELPGYELQPHADLEDVT